MKVRTVVATIILLATAVACGSSPEAPAASGGGTTAGSDIAGDTSAADDTESSGDASDAASTDDGPVVEGADVPTDDPDSDDPDAPGDPEFCKQLISAEKQLSAIDQSFTSGDMGSVKSAIAADIGVFQKLADAAPSQIAPAMQDIIDALNAAQQALGGSAPDASALSGLSGMTNDINALGNYVADNCAAYATAG